MSEQVQPNELLYIGLVKLFRLTQTYMLYSQMIA